MDMRFERTAQLIGEEALETLGRSSVIVFGVGGVGSYAAEGLVRAGIGKITVVDHDHIDITNINRQIHALQDTLGRLKVEVMTERLKKINPNCEVKGIHMFFDEKNADLFDFRAYDFVIDAVDTVSSKIGIIEKAYSEKVRIISSMGTGNKLDPTAFKIARIADTKVCPLARVMRRELKKIGIDSVRVLYSEEKAHKTEDKTPSSISFVPSAAGLIIAGETVREIIKDVIRKG